MKSLISKININKKSLTIIIPLVLIIVILGWIYKTSSFLSLSYNNSSTIMINALDNNKIDYNGKVSEDYLNQWTTYKGNANVILNTNYGDIEIQLYTQKAPMTVTNFLNLAKVGYYNDTKFHRVIKDFMIQGGDFNSKNDNIKDLWGTGGPGYAFLDEFTPEDNMVQGDIAMANSGPNTNGSQFFIVTAKETPWLNGKHTIFGKVVEGMDIVLKIQNSKVDSKDRPIEPVIIKTVEIKEIKDIKINSD